MKYMKYYIDLESSKIPKIKMLEVFCNSLWGTYDQPQNSSQTKACLNRKVFHNIVFNDKYESTFDFLSQKAVLVNYK